MLEDEVVKQIPAEDTKSPKVPETLQPLFHVVSGNYVKYRTLLVPLCAKAAGWDIFDFK
jgi:hypothetical protein